MHATPSVAAQLRAHACNSGHGCATPNSANTTPVMLTDPSPRHKPLVIPSRVFLRVFSLDFPLLG
ncbi:hypothetical protein PILCRDRAFT_17005 [Piloderma croceum F 1598]|uniref:Uncharacterized protein n=1 Tax=Piloderma croceum (strain F 1598) TaxID=765440 RepID=A0A0C3ACL2_PILCF|nr:hypothetical protein PILCRDRAFT_17005 [Piloderma croceum F 1598]